MSVVFCLFVFAGGTIQLVDGEIFEGRIVGESSRRIWLQVDNGGLLSFDKSKVASVSGRPYHPEPKEESEPESESASGPTGEEKMSSEDPACDVSAGPPEEEEFGVDLPPAVGEKEYLPLPGKTKKGERGVRITRPVGFRLETKNMKPPRLGVLIEESSGAQIAVSAEKAKAGVSETISEFRKKLGSDILAERSFHVGRFRARLFEWRRGNRSCMDMVLVHGGMVYQVRASVREELSHAYRNVFLRVIKSFSPVVRERKLIRATLTQPSGKTSARERNRESSSEPSKR